MPSEFVWVVNPHGMTVEVRANEVESLLKKGYTLTDETVLETVQELDDNSRGSAEPEAVAPQVSTGVEDQAPSLEELSRKELNEMAEKAGVKTPHKLPNKKAVIEALNAASA